MELLSFLTVSINKINESIKDLYSNIFSETGVHL